MARSRKSVDELIGAALDAPAAAGPAAVSDPADASAAADSSRPWAVAFSGGLDSTVLLHAVARAAGPARVLALHVHPGLQPAADAWIAHCAAVASRLGTGFRALRARGAPARGDSVEAWARGERYRLLLAAAREVRAAALLTAHHADDQLETVLLALARGSGLDGLTGIAARDRRAGVTLLRPLLALDRVALEADARERGLVWIEDPSNADPAYTRNALRARAMPALRDALPSLVAQLPDALELLAGARATLDALARGDLASASQDGGALRRTALAALPPARTDAALRAWLVDLGASPPTRRALAEMRAQLVEGDAAHGDVGFGPWRLLRHRERIVAVPRDAMPPPVDAATLRWPDDDAPIVLAGGRLAMVEDPDGVSADWLRARAIEVGAPGGAERLRTYADGPSRTLKNLWQEAGVPTWLRRAMPAVRVDGRLLAVAPFGTDRGAGWPREGRTVTLRWRPDDPADPRAAWTGGAADGTAML
ncbi:MAG: tRNA lysidine(34) synthetase TilS [Burkholderiales bacterium]